MKALNSVRLPAIVDAHLLRPIVAESALGTVTICGAVIEPLNRRKRTQGAPVAAITDNCAG